MSTSIDLESLALTILIFTSEEEREELLIYSSPSVRDLIKEKEKSLKSATPKRQLALFSTELGKLLSYSQTSCLSRIHVSWLVQELKQEDPFIVQCILSAMPLSLAQSIALSMTPPLTQFQVPFKLGKALKNSLLENYAAQFTFMPPDKVPFPFQLEDLPFLSLTQLNQLVKELGKQQLSSIFAALGLKVAADLLGKLGQNHQNQIISAISQTAPSWKSVHAENIEFAQDILGSFVNLDDLLQKSGVFALAQAYHNQPLEQAHQLAQRLFYEYGQRFLNYLEKINQKYFTAAHAESIQKYILDNIEL